MFRTLQSSAPTMDMSDYFKLSSRIALGVGILRGLPMTYVLSVGPHGPWRSLRQQQQLQEILNRLRTWRSQLRAAE
eukprot:2969215-Amphidinium_carterae.1